MKNMFKWYITTWRKKEWSDSEALDILYISLYSLPIIGGLIMLIVAIINDLKLNQ